MSQPDYYREKNKALCELAYKLGIEVEGWEPLVVAVFIYYLYNVNSFLI